MCKLCVCVVLLAALALAEGFFLPIFVRKQAPQTPAVSNIGWSAPPQSTYKDFSGYSGPPQGTPLQPVAMPSIQQYTYDTPSLTLSAYHQQMQPQPQFHNVQLVPCLCPLTRDVIEHQAQAQAQAHHPSQVQAMQSQDSSKSTMAQTGMKTS